MSFGNSITRITFMTVVGLLVLYSGNLNQDFRSVIKVIQFNVQMYIFKLPVEKKSTISVRVGSIEGDMAHTAHCHNK